MKTLVIWSLKQALNKIALVAFVIANVSPAFGQNMGTSSTWIPLAPGAFSDPALIMQTQANINIYGMQGNSLGQLPPGSIFQTQMARDPFHHVMMQPTFHYPSIFSTAVQIPTPMGMMIPATMEQPAMLANGMTLPIDTSFYIPPADFSYQNIRAIGARSDVIDRDIDRLLEEIMLGSDRDHDTHYVTDDYDYEDSEGASRISRSSRTDFFAKRVKQVEPQPSARTTHRPAAQPVTYRTDVQNDGPFRIAGPTCGCRDKGRACTVSGAYGTNRQVGKKRHKHAGLDISGNTGSPIIAAADGVVTVAYRSNSYGNVIDIKHADGYMTRYAHMTRYTVRPGQRVKKGEVVGYMGSTGRSSGPHLHFELCKLKSATDTRCHAGNVMSPIPFMSTNGTINQQRQLNMSCNEVAASGGNTSGNASQTPRPARSGGAVQ